MHGVQCRIGYEKFTNMLVIGWYCSDVIHVGTQAGTVPVPELGRATVPVLELGEFPGPGTFFQLVTGS